MKRLMFVAAMTLAACSAKPPLAPAAAAQPAVAQGAVADAGKPEAAAQTPEQTPEQTPVQTPEQLLIGRWGDNGDCNKDVVFNADGSFHSYTGGDGQWALIGDQLTMTGKQGTFVLRLNWLDNDRVETTDPSGAVGHSQRCS